MLEAPTILSFRISVENRTAPTYSSCSMKSHTRLRWVSLLTWSLRLRTTSILSNSPLRGTSLNAQELFVYWLCILDKHLSFATKPLTTRSTSLSRSLCTCATSLKSQPYPLPNPASTFALDTLSWTFAFRFTTWFRFTFRLDSECTSP